MADEREGAEAPAKPVANDDKIQTPGRQANDAKPLNAADDEGGPERYPSVRQDDAVEVRSFEPRAKQQGFEGPGGDPAEGKR